MFHLMLSFNKTEASTFSPSISNYENTFKQISNQIRIQRFSEYILKMKLTATTDAGANYA